MRPLMCTPSHDTTPRLSPQLLPTFRAYSLRDHTSFRADAPVTVTGAERITERTMPSNPTGARPQPLLLWKQTLEATEKRTRRQEPDREGESAG